MPEIGGQGPRIRALRLQQGRAQTALARAAGISPSYLNLIEHGRRPIGGKLLGDLARALDTDPADLAPGADGALVEGLRRTLAEPIGPAPGPTPEAHRTEALAAAYPGWSGLIVSQRGRIAALERTVATLGERLSHDPLLSASVHDVLSAVTAIRSTSAILVEDPALDPDWQARFHRNLFEDSRRLADSARALAAQLEGGDPKTRGGTTPQDEVDAWLTARDHHIPDLEGADPADALPPDLARELPGGMAGRLLTQHLHDYARDAADLPLPTMKRTVAEVGVDPFAAARMLDRDPGQVMRRMATLPVDMLGHPVGLVVSDGAGALIHRRALPGFGLPRFGTGCALWPLYDALWSGRPIARRLQQPGRASQPVRAFATGRVDHPLGPGGPPVARAHMLLVPDMADADRGTPADPVGQSCRICPRPQCPARSEPSILPEASPDAPPLF